MNFSNKKVYILCVANLRSGGPEALHQLRYYMQHSGLDSYMVYYNITEGIDPMPAVYGIYEVKQKLLSEIEDDKNNILIAAESSTILLNGFTKIKKYIWWLSVNWCDYKKAGTAELLRYRFKRLLGMESALPSFATFRLKECLHVCGSKYALQYVQGLGILNPRYLVEPISKEFLIAGNDSNYQRDNTVLYNPAKPSEIMTKLLAQKRFKFKALTNMTPSDLIEAYKHAKLYIDFGHFGGPERMPKEAVYFGCCILVGNRNAAANDFDVAIPDRYKIADYNNLQLVSDKIEYLLNNYRQCIVDFEPFRTKISLLEQNFMNQINNIFIK